MEEVLMSAGIDIGTTTTQVIFSRLTIADKGGFGAAPGYAVTRRDVFYRGRVHFTPLLPDDSIDKEEVARILSEEFESAGLRPDDMDTGAVIITGETLKRANAKEVAESIAALSGRFVVTTAGPHLESVLAGKGSGAAELSTRTGKLVANVDIGGGTSNLCFFDDGTVLDTACLDLGGRGIRIENHKIAQIFPGTKRILEAESIRLSVGDSVDSSSVRERIENLADVMARLLAEALLLLPESPTLRKVVTNRLITCDRIPEIVTLSGGVADLLGNLPEDPFRYGDIGAFLGASIARNGAIRERLDRHTKETLRATVIGAGNESLTLSGGTVFYQKIAFPLRDLPVVSLPMDGANPEAYGEAIGRAWERIREDGETTAAFASEGLSAPTYEEICRLADAAAKAARQKDPSGSQTWVFVFATDMGKAFGQAFRRRMPPKTSILAMDSVRCGDEDRIDCGDPIGRGDVIPVVVKTLLFDNGEKETI